MFGRNPFELLENTLLVFFTNADPLIAYVHPRLTALTVHLHGDRALRAVSQGVGQQVGNHLFYTKFVPIALHRMLGVQGDRGFGGIDLWGEIL
ncbi:hypothetical protein D3C84_751500 [compost metagenome]